MATRDAPHGRRARATANAKRAEPPMRRSRDFPIDVADGVAYVIKGIPPAIWGPVNTRRTREGRSVRWIVLTLLDRYAKGDITL